MKRIGPHAALVSAAEMDAVTSSVQTSGVAQEITFDDLQRAMDLLMREPPPSEVVVRMDASQHRYDALLRATSPGERLAYRLGCLPLALGGIPVYLSETLPPGALEVTYADGHTERV